MLRKFTCKKAAWKLAKTVGKDSGYKSGGLHCVYGQKDNRIQILGLGYIPVHLHLPDTLTWLLVHLHLPDTLTWLYTSSLASSRYSDLAIYQFTCIFQILGLGYIPVHLHLPDTLTWLLVHLHLPDTLTRLYTNSLASSRYSDSAIYQFTCIFQIL